MRLESVRISKFRSVKNESFGSLSNFNVLIGKNNSGKSTILSAIYTFFKCVSGNDIVNLAPPIGDEIDFFNRESKLPVEISLAFTLSSSEWEEIVNSIISDTPQMKNVAEGIEPESRLLITLCVNPKPKGYSYINNILVAEKEWFSTSSLSVGRTLLKVNPNTAEEMYQKANEYRSVEEATEFLREISRRFDEDDWQRFTEERKNRSIPFQYLFGRRLLHSSVDIDAEITRELERISRKAETFTEFKENIESFANQVRSQFAASQNQSLSHKVSTFSGDDSKIPQYVYKILSKVASQKVLYLTERRKPIGEEEARRLLSLKTQRGGTEALRNIQETVNSLLGVQIDAFQGKGSVSRGEMPAEMDVDNFLVEVNGSGIREALRLLLDVEFVRPDIILVEEPELHLHPGLETNMMLYLKRISAYHQVIITTHSTNFLDTAELTNIYLVFKNTASQVKHLTFDEAENLLPSELGIRLSSLFLYDRLVFVEGQSDEDVIREWAAILNVNLSKSNVGFIRMGGVRNFSHFAAEKVLSFLTKRQVEIWFFLDRDERDVSEIEELRTRLKDKAKLIVLKKREIENYLIHPRALCEFIRNKLSLQGTATVPSTLSESEIQAAMHRAAESLKDFSIEKRLVMELCHPVYFSAKDEGLLSDKDMEGRILYKISQMITELEERKSEIKKAHEQIVQQVEQSWSRDKLSIVPGDILLDKVCQQFGVRFKKERDSSRIAMLMNDNEIEPDIKNFIRELGR